MLLKEGIGWGYMPEPMVREDLKRGQLVRLDMPEYKNGFIRLHAIYRTDTPPGPAGAWLIVRFVAQAEGVTDAANQRSIRATSRRRTMPPFGDSRTMISPNSSGEVNRPCARTEYVYSCPFGAGAPPTWPAGLTAFCAWIADTISGTVMPSFES